MEKVFHDNGNGTLNVSVTYAPADYQPIVVKVMNKLVEDVTVKGFRKGKAPKEVAMRYVRNEDIYNGMVNKLIDRDFASLLDGYEDLKEVANIRPNLNVTNDDKAKSYNFLYTFVFLPKAEVKKVTGFKVKEDKKTISDEDVDKEITKLLTDAAELVPSKEEAANGDHVTIDFVGYVDGKPFEGGSANDYELTLGSHSFVPGFEEGLVGAKEGDKKNLDITFPKDYLASLANKPAKFTVTVKGVKKVVLPKADDEFAASAQGYKVKTLAELKTAVKEKLQKDADVNSRAAKIDKIFAEIEKDAKVTIADQYLDLAADQVKERQLGQFKQYGMDLDQYLSVAGLDLKTFTDNCRSSAKNDAVRYALIEAVAKAAKIEVTDEDLAVRFGGKDKYDEMLKKVEEAEKKNPDANYRGYLDNVRENVFQGKVNDYLYANN